MGCDIHLCVEVRKDGRWETSHGRNHWYDRYLQLAEEHPENRDYYLKQAQEETSTSSHWFYDDRNYDLFTILAGVRGGFDRFGLGVGIGTGRMATVIAPPRGIPSDVSDEVREDYEGWGADGHSASYLTLKELQDYDWDSKVIQRGWVDLNEYKEMLANGRPRSWCGGVGGGQVEHVSVEVMSKIASGETTLPKDKMPYTCADWTVPAREECADFLSRLPELEALGAPEDVRIVFWFDN